MKLEKSLCIGHGYECTFLMARAKWVRLGRGLGAESRSCRVQRRACSCMLAGISDDLKRTLRLIAIAANFTWSSIRDFSWVPCILLGSHRFSSCFSFKLRESSMKMKVTKSLKELLLVLYRNYRGKRVRWSFLTAYGNQNVCVGFSPFFMSVIHEPIELGCGFHVVRRWAVMRESLRSYMDSRKAWGWELRKLEGYNS